MFGNWQDDLFYRDYINKKDKEPAIFCDECEEYYDGIGQQLNSGDAVDNYEIYYEICENCKRHEK